MTIIHSCFIIIALRIIENQWKKLKLISTNYLISINRIITISYFISFKTFNSNQDKEFINSFNGKIGISKMFLEMFKVGTKDKKKYVI